MTEEADAKEMGRIAGIIDKAAERFCEFDHKTKVSETIRRICIEEKAKLFGDALVNAGLCDFMGVASALVALGVSRKELDASISVFLKHKGADRKVAEAWAMAHDTFNYEVAVETKKMLEECGCKFEGGNLSHRGNGEEHDMPYAKA